MDGEAEPRLTSGGKAEACSAQVTSSLDVEDGISHQAAKPGLMESSFRIGSL